MKIALTSGEPAGIGPDLMIQLASEKALENIIIFADVNLLKLRAKILNLPLDLPSLEIIHMECPNIHCLGKPDPRNCRYVLNMLEEAAKGCLNKTFTALVTAPVQKSVINDAGIAFTGHTEFFATVSQVEKTVMLLQTEGLRVALATTHLPLKEVPNAITQKNIKEVLTIINHDLKYRFHIENPRIHICGLNPHAGEQGHLGTEEIDILIPVIEQLKKQGMNLTGPLPADTLFTEQYIKNTDCILAMYHDQGLPVLKYKGFGTAANITLGLPFIRTSVDHGTALDRAGSGKISNSSLKYAIKLAKALSVSHA